MNAEHPAGSHFKAIQEMAQQLGRPLRMMEVCGTHTMTAFRSGLRSLLPRNCTLLSGPGCPVCVTPETFIDQAVAIARQPEVMLTTFGDMLRVPGTESSLELERARGAQVTVLYSAADALEIARQNPDSKVVFLGVGFETTCPSVAWTIREASLSDCKNFSVLCAHKTMPRAMQALLLDGSARIDGFLCPGHVSTIIGSRPYQFIAEKHHIPCVIAGFGPLDMVLAIEMLLKQLVEKRAEVENEYTRSVSPEGNPDALDLIEAVFEECDAEWRGLGVIPGSGLRLRREYAAHDADLIFPGTRQAKKPTASKCICADILKGIRTPLECPLFKSGCTPATPVGACMVSSEGTCAAYYKYANL